MIWNAQELRIWVAHLRILSTWLISMTWKAHQWKIWAASPWLKKIFGFWCSEMHQNEVSGWRKLWILIMWNTPDWMILFDLGNDDAYFRVSSPWLKKILHFDDLKYTRMKNFGAYLRISSPWLKEIMDFDDVKCTRKKDFGAYLRISSPWLKIILHFDDVKCTRRKDFDDSSQSI